MKRGRDKNHTFISIYTGKAFDKIQHHDKSPKETRNKMLISQYNKSYIQQVLVNIILIGGKLNVFPLK
jgi:hypothetical protein